MSELLGSIFAAVFSALFGWWSKGRTQSKAQKEANQQAAGKAQSGVILEKSANEQQASLQSTDDLADHVAAGRADGSLPDESADVEASIDAANHKLR